MREKRKEREKERSENRKKERKKEKGLMINYKMLKGQTKQKVK